MYHNVDKLSSLVVFLSLQGIYSQARTLNCNQFLLLPSHRNVLTTLFAAINRIRTAGMQQNSLIPTILFEYNVTHI